MQPNPDSIGIQSRLNPDYPILVRSRISIRIPCAITQYRSLATRGAITEMAEKGRVWMDAETKLLLEIWSQDTIQRQLKGAFRNVNVFAQVVEELRKSGYHRTVQQCRIKIKSLKTKYKAVVDRARRSGAGNESDEEEDLPSDFAYFSQIDAVMAGRPNVKPVHLLDSAFYEEEHEMGAGERKVVSPVLSPDQSVTPSSQPEIPSPSVSQSETPGPSVSQPETPGPSVGNQKPLALP